MRKVAMLLSILLLLVIILGSWTSADASAANIGIVSTRTSLNVRSGPGTNYRVIGSLRNGTRVALLGSSGNWYKINYGGKTGFVSKSYVKVQAAPTKPAATTQTVKKAKTNIVAGYDLAKPLTVINTGQTTALNIRASANSKSRIVGKVYGQLSPVTVLNKYSNGYSRIKALDYDSLRMVIGYVPTKYLKTVVPNQRYLVIVDKRTQRMLVYKDGKCIKNLVCSTGLPTPQTETPVGTFLLGDRVPQFTSYGETAYYAYRFNKGYYIHSVTSTPGKGFTVSEANLGKKASHGCVRIPYNEAKWVYSNLPKGTVVVVR